MNRIKNVISGMPSDIGFSGRADWGKIQFVHLGSSDDEGGSLVVEFKAFVKRFTDSFNPDWKESQYPNQSVPIAHQVRPRRDLHIEWTVPAANEAEALSNLGKCSALAQMMFPTLKRSDDWSSLGNKKMFYPRSSFIGVKFANLIQGHDGGAQPGYIRGFNYTPNFEEGVLVANQKMRTIPKAIKDTMWVADKNEAILAPMFIDISVDFTPFYIRKNVGYVHGGEGWINPGGADDGGWPYGINFRKNVTQKDKSGTQATDICITNPSEGGWHDVCTRSMIAGARGIMK